MTTIPPHLAPNASILVSGKHLNTLRAAIRERTPLAGPGLLSTETPNGTILRVADMQPVKRGN